jgi:hypothetical protein
MVSIKEIANGGGNTTRTGEKLGWQRDELRKITGH